MALKQRARKQEDKQARRAAILEAAATLLLTTPFSSITMAELARHCQLAKGTLYLYFMSKEALFLAMLEQELALWFDDLAQRLRGTAAIDAERFGLIFAASVGHRDRLTHLLAIVHTILERNVDRDTVVAFKRTLKHKVLGSGRIIESVVPGVRPGQGTALMLRMHALVIGLRQMSQAAPNVAKVLQQDEFAVLRIEFEPALAAAVTDLVRGMQAG